MVAGIVKIDLVPPARSWSKHGVHPEHGQSRIETEDILAVDFHARGVVEAKGNGPVEESDIAPNRHGTFIPREVLLPVSGACGIFRNTTCPDRVGGWSLASRLNGGEGPGQHSGCNEASR